jgi:hypothetical protein
MSKKLKEEFAIILNSINNEGLGYYLLDYTDENSMPDKKSKKLFKKSLKSLKKFKNYIEEKSKE